MVLIVFSARIAIYLFKFTVYNLCMGIPRILNEQLIQDFADNLRKGLFINTVCDLLMVTSRRYHAWLEQGEQDLEDGNEESIYAAFTLTIKKSRAEFEAIANQRITDGQPGWQGTAWWLERTRQEFMPSQRIEANDGGKVQVVIGGKVKQMKHDKR